MRDSVIREERTSKKESRSEFDLAGISGSSSISKSEISTEMTHERPSVLEQLKGYRAPAGPAAQGGSGQKQAEKTYQTAIRRQGA